MKNKIFLLMSIMLMLLGAVAEAALPAVSGRLLTPEAWLKEEGNAVVASAERIAELNKSFIKEELWVWDLEQLPNTVDKKTLLGYIAGGEMEDDLYIQGRPLLAGEAQGIVRDARAGVAESNKVRYAVAVDYTDVRTFPTMWRAFETASDREFDEWQETTLRPAQPVLVLCYNGRGNFAYVQAADYRGWVAVDKLAFCDRGTWLGFLRPRTVAVVTQGLYTFKEGKRSWSCPMGTTVPLVDDRLQLPVRGAGGRLEISAVTPVYGEGIHKGFLPYTRNNIIKMAFKYLGAPYGWGNMHKSVDCSGLIQNVYRTVGLFLPRNADAQMLCIRGKNVNGLTNEEKLAVVRQYAPGSVLCYPTHIALSLGTEGGVPYMIHSLGSFGAIQRDGRIVKESVLQVVVTPVDIYGGSGRKLLVAMEQVNDFK